MAFRLASSVILCYNDIYLVQECPGIMSLGEINRMHGFRRSILPTAFMEYDTARIVVQNRHFLHYRAGRGTVGIQKLVTQ